MTVDKRIPWLQAGLFLLEESGTANMTIDELTQRVGLTKGSFYHHFKDRGGYVKALLEYWEEQMTHRLIEQADLQASSKEKQRHLTQLTLALYDSPLELNLRAWAMSSPLVKSYVERVDQARVEYLNQIALEITGDAERARQLAEIAYAVFVGGQQILPQIPRERLLELYGELDRLYR
ncbi:MAG: TetR/AcrR family transcriptional regulator [Candidatus Hydrogenedentes bacterium]|nr:TetR/AcrR family transcriptional regulator [Candidatus Hydrogenedentota bacterium]